MEDGYIIDAKTRKKALKFKGEYEGLFKEMSGIMHRRADVVNAYMDGRGCGKIRRRSWTRSTRCRAVCTGISSGHGIMKRAVQKKSPKTVRGK